MAVGASTVTRMTGGLARWTRATSVVSWLGRIEDGGAVRGDLSWVDISDSLGYAIAGPGRVGIGDGGGLGVVAGGLSRVDVGNGICLVATIS